MRIDVRVIRCHYFETMNGISNVEILIFRFTSTKLAIKNDMFIFKFHFILFLIYKD